MFAITVRYTNGGKEHARFSTRSAANQFAGRLKERRGIESITLTTPGGKRLRWLPPDAQLRRMIRQQTRNLFR